MQRHSHHTVHWLTQPPSHQHFCWFGWYMDSATALSWWASDILQGCFLHISCRCTFYFAYILRRRLDVRLISILSNDIKFKCYLKDWYVLFELNVVVHQVWTRTPSIPAKMSLVMTSLERLIYASTSVSPRTSVLHLLKTQTALYSGWYWQCVLCVKTFLPTTNIDIYIQNYWTDLLIFGILIKYTVFDIQLLIYIYWYLFDNIHLSWVCFIILVAI